MANEENNSFSSLVGSENDSKDLAADSQDVQTASEAEANSNSNGGISTLSQESDINAIYKLLNSDYTGIRPIANSTSALQNYIFWSFGEWEEEGTFKWIHPYDDSPMMYAYGSSAYYLWQIYEEEVKQTELLTNGSGKNTSSGNSSSITSQQFADYQTDVMQFQYIQSITGILIAVVLLLSLGVQLFQIFNKHWR